MSISPIIPFIADDDDQNLGGDSGSSAGANSGNNSSNSSVIYSNVLTPYSSYTYNITLQVTTPDNYNDMIDNQSYDPTTWTTILKSGGVGPIRAHNPSDNSGNATAYFSRDLYIDDLEFTTLIGLNQESRASNVTEVHFVIQEPNGMSLIEELYDFCHNADGLNESNYIQLPYLLVISFNGYKDDGSWETVQNATKYIPIQIFGMDVRVNSSGATYTVTAIPFTEMAFTEQYGRLNKTAEITGYTLNDYGNSLANAINQDQQNYVTQGIYDLADTYTITFLAQDSSETGGSIDIGSTLLASPEEIANKDKPMGPVPSDGTKINLSVIASNFQSYQTLNNVQSQSTVINIGNSSVKFNSGSSLLDCLNNLVISSEYVTKQVVDFQQKLAQVNQNISQMGSVDAQSQAVQDQIATLNYPFQWYKIVCTQMELGDYDTKRNVYQKNITYTVKPYLVDNTKSPFAPSQTPSLRVVKEYDYIFTGKNTEVLDFELNFNTAYINYAQVNTDTKGQGSGAKTPLGDENKQSSTAAGQQPLVVSATPSSSILTDSKSIVGVPNSSSQTNSTGLVTPARGIASDIVSTLYAKAELLLIELSILGDPDYISQSSIFLTPGDNLDPYTQPTTGAPGGINFDNGEIWFNMNFLIPQDYDLSTGIMNIYTSQSSPQFKRNVFSGFYSVISVSNMFRQGRFTQQLQARRFDDSQTYNVTQSNTSPTAPNNNQNTIIDDTGS
jgi:hypothetical protein